MITFHVTAGRQVGFGHLSRCLALAALLEDRAEVQFAGDFDASAKAMVDQHDFRMVPRDGDGSGDVAVIDMMFDPIDMDRYDTDIIQKIANSALSTILISSAATCPKDLPVDVVIGYHPRVDIPAVAPTYVLYWGLEYAPIPKAFIDRIPERRHVRDRIERCVVGLGGSERITGLLTTLGALSDMAFSGHVDILLSPLHGSFFEEVQRAAACINATIHHRVASVAPLLEGADCAIVSYGNFMYEAMSFGVPTCVMGVKEFQVRYAETLADQGLILSLGDAECLEREQVCATMQAFNHSLRSRLSRKSMETIDALGLSRIADHVLEKALRLPHSNMPRPVV
jgi:spore coat polysaccharide biosynthesis predicted glycosyltransferase SpsG